jgi:hypothetical protein
MVDKNCKNAEEELEKGKRKRVVWDLTISTQTVT